MEAERSDLRRPAQGARQASRACACTSSATRSSTATPTATLIGGMTKTPTMSVRYERQHRLRRRRRRSSPSTCARPAPTSTFSTVLGDDALEGFRARRIWRSAGVNCNADHRSRRGRPPTRTRSSPAATACSRSTRSTTARSPTRSCEQLREQIARDAGRRRRLQRFPPRHLQPRHDSAADRRRSRRASSASPTARSPAAGATSSSSRAST